MRSFAIELPADLPREGSARVAGVRIAYRVRGSGPPLVLLIGYRLAADAWPDQFIDSLAERFTVVAIDNRGTGGSDKPVEGYGLPNMADDVVAVLDSLGIAKAHALGYSMGGGIAQELACRHPGRIMGLVLCATLCGGATTIRSPLSTLRILRDLDGRQPEEVGRRMWQVTYSSDYLSAHRDRAERQLQREIRQPTPLHAADLQFQALSELDTSSRLPNLRVPTLVMTGDLDQIVLPHNSTVLVGLIPDSVLRIVHGCGHRLMWEKPEKCARIVADFLEDSAGTPPWPREAFPLPQERGRIRPHARSDIAAIHHGNLWRSMERLLGWPATVEDLIVDLVTKTGYAAVFGSRLRFGDGKPVVLVPPLLVGDLPLSGISVWLQSIGYRPSGIGLLPSLDERTTGRAAAAAIGDAVRRVGRKAVVIAFGDAAAAVSRVVKTDEVSDVVVIGPPPGRPAAMPRGIRLHALKYTPSGGAAGARRLDGWPFPPAMIQNTFIAISDILYAIPIALRPETEEAGRGPGE